MFSLLMYFVRNDKNKDDQSINKKQSSDIGNVMPNHRNYYA